MAKQTIMLMRHAEKPQPDGDSGVDPTGKPDIKSLTPRGWQRAGAWAQLFAPAFGRAPFLPKPDSLFASNPSLYADEATDAEDDKSHRPMETISPLAEMIGLDIDLRFKRRSVADLASAVVAAGGTVLVCWQHEEIVAIARAISPTSLDIPSKWPSDRFNVIFQFDRSAENATWAFRQVVPILLQGDPSNPIA